MCVTDQEKEAVWAQCVADGLYTCSKCNNDALQFNEWERSGHGIEGIPDDGAWFIVTKCPKCGSIDEYYSQDGDEEVSDDIEEEEGTETVGDIIERAVSMGIDREEITQMLYNYLRDTDTDPAWVEAWKKYDEIKARIKEKNNEPSI